MKNDKLLNTSDVTTNSFSKGMLKDVADIGISEGFWKNAINAINRSHTGEVFTIGNEQSNEFCTTTPYSVIGFIYLENQKWCLFLSDDTNSEIGIFDETNCSYQIVVNDSCLNFKKSNLITGSFKKNYDSTYTVYFQDGLNYDRFLNLSNVPKKIIGDSLSDPNCITPIYSNELDCDKLRLQPIYNQPCITLNKSVSTGQLNNGSYIVSIAYTESGNRVTDFCIPSTPISMWEHSGIGGSIVIKIENLDQRFEEYELVIIGIVNQQVVAKRLGYYSTQQYTIEVGFINDSLPTVDIGLIPLKKNSYLISDKIFDVNNYLIRTGVKDYGFVNYQKLANQIVTYWNSVEYPDTYYFKSGTNTGYFRDEVYSFFIRWVYDTGAVSASYHIPGRSKRLSDSLYAGGSDSLPGESERWEVYDTATTISSTPGPMLPDGGLIVEYGLMGYHESSEKYPDDAVEIWGDLCGRKIRHHKMPSNERTHIHDNIGNKIYILGVSFGNIKHPLDSNGNPIKEIIGFEILRGSRENNKTVIAKGMFNNMREYELEGDSGKKGLFQNYPYNDLRPDPFLTSNRMSLELGYGTRNKIEDERLVISGIPNDFHSKKLDTYKNNYFSFHSPETNFLKPYLGDNHIKIYNEEKGTALGGFDFVYKHPKHKLLKDAVLLPTLAIASGIALLGALGTTTTSYSLGVNVGAAVDITGTRIASPVTAIPDLITRITSSAGADLASIGTGIIGFVVSYVYITAEAWQKVLEIVKKFIPHRDYVLQYNSHAFYNQYFKVDNNTPIGVKPSFRRNISEAGAKYISNGVQDFDNTYQINNLNRNKYVAIKIDGSLPDVSSLLDNTRQRIQDRNDSGNTWYKSPKGLFTSQTCAYYGAIKVKMANQYGQLEDIIQLPINSCTTLTEPSKTKVFKTSVIFGGDCYINRYTEKNPYYFFNTWLTDLPDGVEFNYKNYVNGPTPRYWADFSDYDISELIKPNTTNPTGSSLNAVRTFFNNLRASVNPPSNYTRLDTPINQLITGVFGLKNSYMYLFYNGVRDFFVESEINLAFRDYGEEPHQKFYDPYSNSFNDLTTMFRSDLITKPITYKYDLSLSASKLYTNFVSWGSVLPRQFDSNLFLEKYKYYPKRVIYSLQNKPGFKKDNWLYYLPLNYRDFMGKISSIKSFNVQGALILFEDAEPILFSGIDQLQTTNNIKITVGDGGLFSENYQSITNADNEFQYGTCSSSKSVINTPYGMFWISQKSGKIFNYANQLKEISKNGLKYWFNQHLPSSLLKYTSDYVNYDNPVAGIACQAVYDPNYEIVYFTKKDYVVLSDDIKFDEFGKPYIICGRSFEYDDSVVETTLDSTAFPGMLYVPANTFNVTMNNTPTDNITINLGDVVEIAIIANVIDGGGSRVLLQISDIGEVLTGNVSINIKPVETKTYTVRYYDEENELIYDHSFTINVIQPVDYKCYVDFDNEQYFKKCNWTISYDPTIEMFISFHSWEPTFLLGSQNHFLTILEDSIWRHNVRYDSFCNFYSINHSWEVEFNMVTPNSIFTLRNIEYYMDVYKYDNNGINTIHNLDYNFDSAYVYNSEQNSGLLRLVLNSKTNPFTDFNYPIRQSNLTEILYTKEENKFRFNQFEDLTKDRGEVSNATDFMWITKCDGYRKSLKSDYINYNKSSLEAKKFRHYSTSVILKRSVSGAFKMILKFINTKLLFSSR